MYKRFNDFLNTVPMKARGLFAVFLTVLVLSLGYCCVSTYKAIDYQQALVTKNIQLTQELAEFPGTIPDSYKDLVKRLVKHRDLLSGAKNHPGKPLPVISVGTSNANPGNVKKPSNGHWKGTIAYDRRNFAVFEHHVYGIRAMAITLLAYEHKHGIKTVDKLIDRYSKTDRAKYKTYVAKRLGVKVNQKISITKRLPELVDAIITFELSEKERNTMGIRAMDISRGVQMALNDSKWVRK